MLFGSGWTLTRFGRCGPCEYSNSSKSHNVTKQSSRPVSKVKLDIVTFPSPVLLVKRRYCHLLMKFGARKNFPLSPPLFFSGWLLMRQVSLFIIASVTA